MKVLQVIPSLIKGGAERLVLDITRVMRQTPNVEVKLVYFNDINDYPEEYSDVKVELLDVHVTPSVFGKWSVNLDQWEELLNEFQPDIIHSHLFAADLLSRFNIRDGIKYVSHCHDNMRQLRTFRSDSSLSKSRLADLYERNFIIGRYKKSKNTFISISPDTTEYFSQNLPNELARKIIELPNAINTQKFNRNCSIPLTNDEPLRILNVGSFVPKKNQTLLVDIGIELNKNGVDFEIRFAGAGPELENVKRKVEQHNLSKQIIFLGNVENVEEEMWNSHIYVHTANYEPFGLVLLEAMAAGLPVISLDGRGNRALILDGENGFFIKTQNPETFTERILELKADENLWQKFSNSGIEFSKKFDIRNYVQQLLEIYQDQSNRLNE